MSSEFWHQKPARGIDWELENEKVILLVPKFRHRILQRWLVPHLAKPNFRVQLDAVGSAFWKWCDGTKTLEEIKIEMKNQFGEQIEPIDDRLSRFVCQLADSKFLKFE
mgnify:CR=1 FL=1